MDAQRKRKRSLPDDSSPSSAGTDAALTRSAELYFDDGNIVLVAENVAFRVYKGQLARHSAVFRDMFSVVNQPTTISGENFDGCPTVRLSDTSRDITMLLCALNGDTHFTCDAEGVRALTSVLRMATKYLMDSLHGTCIKALRESYPDTLAQWDRSGGMRFYPNVVVQLIDAGILLPSAYYALCEWSLDSLSSEKDKLPSHVLEAYCRGKEKIADIFATFFEEHISVGGSSVDERPSCEGPGSKDCQSAWDGLEFSAVLSLGHAYRVIRPDPLGMLQELLEDSCTEDMCRKCHKYLKEIIEEERAFVWVSLPEFFGLGSWEELRGKYKRDSLR